MSRYREMQAFAAVAQTGSLAGAARRLEISPATMMRTIAALEKRLSNTLLTRGPRGVTLSPAGEQFALNCRDILQQTDAAERSAAGLHACPAGQLTVSLPILMDHAIFTPVMLAYLDAFPDVQLVILSREGLPKLLEEGIDIALVVSHLPNSSDFAMPLGWVRPVVCGAPDYLAKWGFPATPDELIAHRTVVTTALGYEAGWRFRHERSTHLVKLAPVLRCSTTRAAIQAAAQGLGLTRCMSYEAHAELQDGSLIPVLNDFISEDLPVHMIYRNGRRAEARVRSFIDFATPLLRVHPAFTR
ncbi:LysR family transcriptional regulator [Pseudomonas sp. NPDC078700]|uniref:LysR family transcriptional regulator n=1 Tax=Pseudomonas sp. NPDC078700 TaxID=3364424 RepID=UPI0037C7BDDF